MGSYDGSPNLPQCTKLYLANTLMRDAHHLANDFSGVLTTGFRRNEAAVQVLKLPDGVLAAEVRAGTGWIG